MAPPSKRRKLNSSTVEKITFDSAAREEYLTGFHKRKQARIRHAQEIAARKEKEERDRERRELRRQRREEVEAKLREVEEYARKNGDEGSDQESMEDGDDGGEFEGFDDGADREGEKIDRMDEYVDEGKYAEVTVEEVDVSREGLVKARHNNGIEATDSEAEESSAAKEDSVGRKTKDINGTKKRVWTKEKPKSAKPKKKRKKFRYENKEERKLTRMKERSRNKAQANARRG